MPTGAEIKQHVLDAKAPGVAALDNQTVYNLDWLALLAEVQWIEGGAAVNEPNTYRFSKEQLVAAGVTGQTTINELKTIMTDLIIGA